MSEIQDSLEEEDRIASLITQMDQSEKQQLIFSLIFLAKRPVTFDEISQIIPYSTDEGNYSLIKPIINRINAELNSRSAPYTIIENKNEKTFKLALKKELIEKISFSNYVFTLKIPRSKMKILSFITYKTIIRHNIVSLDDILSKFGVMGINQTNELEKEGLLYQKRLELEDKGKLIIYELTNHFFDIMSFPKEKLLISQHLRDFVTDYLTEEEEDDF